MAISMPKVTSCEVIDCSYNRNRECHAIAITVGDMSHPMCDTFLKSSAKGGIKEMAAGVGACKVQGCQFNASFECSAGSITVGLHEGHADCKTFRSR